MVLLTWASASRVTPLHTSSGVPIVASFFADVLAGPYTALVG